MAANLPLPHRPQQGDGYCLPACVQMVFAYLGISRTQDAIAKTLRLNPPFGTRYSNIKKLASAKIKVTYEVGDKARYLKNIGRSTYPLRLKSSMPRRGYQQFYRLEYERNIFVNRLKLR